MRNGEILYLPVFLNDERFPNQFNMWCEKRKKSKMTPLSWAEHWIMGLSLAVIREASWREQVWGEGVRVQFHTSESKMIIHPLMYALFSLIF